MTDIFDRVNEMRGILSESDIDYIIDCLTHVEDNLCSERHQEEHEDFRTDLD